MICPIPISSPEGLTSLYDQHSPNSDQFPGLMGAVCPPWSGPYRTWNPGKGIVYQQSGWQRTCVILILVVMTILYTSITGSVTRHRYVEMWKYVGWVNLYQKFEIEKYIVCCKLILPKKWKGIKKKKKFVHN